MPMYARDEPTECRPIGRWENGVGWLAHPHENGQRASHAIRGDDGVWIIDPLDAPGVDDLLEAVGEIAGVAVLSDYHARGASAIAERHGVSVHVPRWLDRAAARIDAPVERFAWSLGDSGFVVQRYAPFPGWNEAIAYRESDRTLYVPEALGTAPLFTVGAEWLGIYLLCRALPPRNLLVDLEPERVLVGHGEGIFDDAAAALSDALDGARRRFPHAVVTNGRAQLRAGIEALGD
ncbi:hypothetical protein [Halococcus saccharolyticus]|uniref:MBL fold metallo-hydrolase n=1 Tax=Halococcus saccharolyticus DSM 5350 TaxID=1227455 RepID=M0MFG5_9EURY|nr:hypothetical protein [Halococcus saccharolyticus]EMA44098.1 hypothetical protein C449_11248 [Halococcus saccharolyticus DSM 5350]